MEKRRELVESFARYALGLKPRYGKYFCLIELTLGGYSHYVLGSIKIVEKVDGGYRCMFCDDVMKTKYAVLRHMLAVHYNELYDIVYDIMMSYCKNRKRRSINKLCLSI